MDTLVLPLVRLSIIVAAVWTWFTNIMHLKNGGQWDAEAFFWACFFMLFGFAVLYMSRKNFKAPQSIVVLFFFITFIGGVIVRIFWL
jgi:hypothetical protein